MGIWVVSPRFRVDVRGRCPWVHAAGRLVGVGLPTGGIAGSRGSSASKCGSTLKPLSQTAGHAQRSEECVRVLHALPSVRLAFSLSPPRCVGDMASSLAPCLFKSFAYF